MEIEPHNIFLKNFSKQSYSKIAKINFINFEVVIFTNILYNWFNLRITAPTWPTNPSAFTTLPRKINQQL